ncbi:AAA family ATPase [Paenibacillus faecalis]|uniref:AAA family ATPase n=1 Tax=Paenibacillus faecalis TaxID=2079532 RepID=UPI000D0F96FE|nr:AAA family ATPase [Paenibacillus faecalis]
MVNIPKLLRVRIFSHPIYKTDIDWNIQTGFNFVIGANGLGKTTFLNCIHYGITGNSNIYEQFIKLNKQRKLKTEIKIIVTLLVDETEIEIERRIPHAKPFLKINNKSSVLEYTDPVSVNQEIASLIGVDEINDLDFLLGNFLIRQEEAENVLWSSSVQSKVLHILFRTSEFRQEYNSLRASHGDYHTQHNQKRYHASKLKSDIEKIVQEAEELQKLLEERGIKAEEDNLINDLNREQIRYNQISEIIEELQHEVFQLNDKYEEILNEMEIIEKERSELEMRIESTESNIYTDVYRLSPIDTMAYDELTRLNHCVYCDSTVKQEIVDAIINKSKHNCFFCESDLPSHTEETGSIIDEHDLKRYKVLESNRRILESEEKKIKNEKQKLFEELKKFSRDLSDSEIKLDKYKYQLEFLPREITDINNNLSALELRKEVLEKQWALAREEQGELENQRDHAEQKLIEMEEQNRIALEKIADDLGEEIQKISKFMGLDVSLITEKVPHETEKRVDVHIFVPIVNEIVRASPDQLSKSQSILLDYAFRMAIINYYHKDSSKTNNGMFLLETSEGSFDAAYVKWLAVALVDFSKNNTSFIVVVNLSNKEFLKSLFSEIEQSERDLRTLNVFQHGELQEAHIKGWPDYAEIWNELFGTKSVF